MYEIGFKSFCKYKEKKKQPIENLPKDTMEKTLHMALEHRDRCLLTHKRKAN